LICLSVDLLAACSDKKKRSELSHHHDRENK
jgi:hypothetical protein